MEDLYRKTVLDSGITIVSEAMPHREPVSSRPGKPAISWIAWRPSAILRP